jgi:hypothetical protein
MKTALPRNGLPNDFAKWRETAAAISRVLFVILMGRAQKKKMTSSSQYIWADLRYGTVPHKYKKLLGNSR